MTEEAITLVQFLRDGLDPVADLRGRGPVSPLVLPGGPPGWLVTGYREVREVLADNRRFSNDFANLGTAQELNPGGLGFTDPPAHTRLRKLLMPEFTAHRLRVLEPRVAEIVDGCLDRMAPAEGTTVDLVEAFARPIPSRVIAELLGLPADEWDTVERISNGRFDLTGGAAGGLDRVAESLDYLDGVIKRQRSEPGDGLLGRLIRRHGDSLDDRELAGLADGLLTGGVDTTVSMLSLGAVVLLGQERLDPAWLAPDRVNALVEELLRYLSVVQVAFPRFARTELELGGRTIRVGDMVVCSLSGADRDPELGRDVERLAPDAKRPPHVAFGHGPHLCIGAQLARLELAIAYRALFSRFPDLRLAGPLSFRPLSIVYGVDALPVTW